MSTLPWIGLVVAVFLLTLWTLGPLRDYLSRRGLTDSEGARTSHTGEVPRGGGLVLTPVLLAAWIAAGHGLAFDRLTLVVLATGTAVLFVVCWRDDAGGLPPLVRLLVQLGVVGVALVLAPPGPVFQGLMAPVAEGGLILLLWVGFLNIFNFMDGMDGIAGAETVTIGLGSALVTAVAGLAPVLAVMGLAAAAAVGFLRWNWHPASIFLGDTGSIPLGFLLGWLLLGLAASGQWAPALILALYYLADGGLTLARRALMGERIWQAHRQHFYQRAFTPGDDQRPVLKPILVANGCLMLLATIAAAGVIWPALLVAGAVVAALLWHLERLARARERSA